MPTILQFNVWFPWPRIPMSGNTKTKELNVSSIFQSMAGIREEISHTSTGLQLNGMAIEAQIAQRKIQNGLTNHT